MKHIVPAYIPREPRESGWARDSVGQLEVTGVQDGGGADKCDSRSPEDVFDGLRLSKCVRKSKGICSPRHRAGTGKADQERQSSG